jgi:hypothetical protein
LGQVLLLPVVTASVAFTLSESTAFAGAREWVRGALISTWLTAIQ